MDHDLRTTSGSAGVDHLTDLLVRAGGSFTLLIAHMGDWERSGRGSGRPIDVTLRALLLGVLGPLAHRHAARDLAAAVRVLADALETIGEEVLLVPLDVLDE